MKKITVHYYAQLREQSGINSETVLIDAKTPETVYQYLQKKYHFTLSTNALKIAVNDSFAEWHTPLSDGDSLIFIPPVAGG